ncbi:MAG: nucleotidyltransferase domain-containing protein [Candidatus Nezhaarchaeales archaeon]
MLPREKLRRQAEDLLKKFVEDVERLKPRAILLFGSYARGDFTESSDIDVCVIAENLPSDELQRRTMKGLYSTPKVRAVGFYPEEFLDYLRSLRLFAYDVISEGIPIYDEGFLAEAKKTYEECLKRFKLVKEGKGWRWNVR